MKEADQQLNWMDNNDDAYHDHIQKLKAKAMDNHVDVYHERIQKLKAKAVEDGGLIKKQNISIKECKKHLQLVLEAEKWFKDKLLAKRAMKQQDYHIDSDTIKKDNTLPVKDKEIDALKQQQESLEVKDNEIQDLKQQLGYAQTT
nr:hypothetical protein [Tanacetum cinerariifolium]